eukprot:CAMPEP_0206634592 /NCGR_PEP_ID=MMETSP0325_2-20121206/70122_1 /ASSEMBLY_ACC=CAM_ASM_000347 /TAXON_ID=2866 /ORGANISM="Crypthecodinium cohnii, Strain Seligo" /LENGTH=724 /DNA_ID=CAMNT_0054160395 /DNA_START=159 /DNA_END=2333 /DNA_ORIENTATION=-
MAHSAPPGLRSTLALAGWNPRDSIDTSQASSYSAAASRVGRGNYLQKAASVLMPWVVFVTTIGLFLLTYEDSPRSVWAWVLACGCVSGAITVAGLLGPPGSGQLWLGVWCSASLFMAVCFGRLLSEDMVGPYRSVHSGARLRTVDPTVAPETAMDLDFENLNKTATSLEFSELSVVDDARTIGYVTHGHIYCVAPVVSPQAPDLRIQYWAVGTDCCEQRTNFDCGSARMPWLSRQAVSYPSLEDNHYRKAIAMAAAVHGTRSSDELRLVHFVPDIDREVSAWRESIQVSCCVAFLGHLVWTALLAAAARQVSKAHKAQVDRAKGLRSDYKFLKDDPPFDSGAPMPGDPFNDPFYQGSVGEGGRARRRLTSHGSSTTSMSAVHVEQFFEAHLEDPDFFKNVALARDGGLSEVDESFANLGLSDFCWAAVLPSAILYNVAYLLISDWGFLHGSDTSFDSMYLISTNLILQPGARFLSTLLGFQDTLHVRTQQLFAICEITGMLYNILSVFVTVLLIPFQSRYKRWTWVSDIYWEQLPLLSTYSLMSYLGYVTPHVLLTNFQEEIVHALRDGVITAREWGILVRFVLRHVVYAIVGFDAFLVKFRITSQFVGSNDLSLWQLLGAANFVLQLIGVVRVGKLMQRRLFVFAFAGEDCIMDEKDEMSMLAYNAMLTMKIWENTQSWLRFSVVMLNFGDFDFQKLVVNSRRNGTTTTESEFIDSEAANKTA